MHTVKGLIGLLVGAAGSSAFYFFTLMFLLHVRPPWLLIVPLIAAMIGGIYLFVVVLSAGYRAGFLSTLGVILDLTWSLVNTLAGLVVWLPLSLIMGGRMIVSDDTRRSCVLGMSVNPRGAGWNTTIGTVIAGSWDAHEETHVWQARMFGPVYLISYLIALCLNPLFRMVIGKVANAGEEGYRRICWEDWAYLGGASGSAEVHWGGWFLGLVLSCIYVGFLLLIPIGIFVVRQPLLWIIGAAGILIYCLIRAFLPAV
jgi:hypothetical protein